MFLKTMQAQKGATKYMQKLKKGFYCTICDFNSVEHIDFENKVMNFDIATCADIVKHTFKYSFLFNNIIMKRLNILFRVLKSFPSPLQKIPVTLSDYKTIL